jgi:phosphopantetheine adenylyltransferase
MVSEQKITPNPLVGLMRQPKIFIKLPSGGEYWEPGSIDVPENREFPVYSMTAKDELMLKVPDALMNGQAVVDVIQHCMPNIKNAWKAPNLDLDAILIAIRIATYGEKMTIPLRINDEVDNEYTLDLRIVLDGLQNQIAWDPVVPINEDLTVYVKPLSYKVMTDSALQTFETQKIIQLVSDEAIPEEQKIAAFKESFAKLNQMTIGVINNSVFKVESSQGTTVDQRHIQDFMANADKTVFDKVKGHIDKLRENNAIKPLKIATTPEMRAAGVVEDEIEYPLQFDPTNFFV